MQGQYGTSTRKAILQFAISGSGGAPVLKAGLNCSIVGSPPGTVSVNGVVSTITTTTTGVYQIELADGPVVVGGSTSSGDNDNNTAITVNQFNAAALEVTVSYTTTPGIITLTFGSPSQLAAGTLVNVLFDSCFDGTTNTP